MVEGHAEIIADGKVWVLGDRLDVFEKSPPHCVYVSSETNWSVYTSTKCTLAVCWRYTKKYEAMQIGPTEIEPAREGTNTRYINNIAMEDRDVASTLVTGFYHLVIGHLILHQHDEDDFKHVILKRHIITV